MKIFFVKVRSWQPFSITDGRLVTGQNPASSTSAAQKLLSVLAAEKQFRVSPNQYSTAES